VYRALQPFTFDPQRLPPRRRQPVIPSPLVIVLGAAFGFLDPTHVDETSEGGVERASAEPETVGGLAGDVEDDAVAVTVPVGEGEQHVKDVWRH
jgi:hypothetical protein